MYAECRGTGLIRLMLSTSTCVLSMCAFVWLIDTLYGVQQTENNDKQPHNSPCIIWFDQNCNWFEAWIKTQRPRPIILLNRSSYTIRWNGVHLHVIRTICCCFCIGIWSKSGMMVWEGLGERSWHLTLILPTMRFTVIFRHSEEREW